MDSATTVPKYKTYKPSGVPWLGEIPEHWLVERGKWQHKTQKEPNKRRICDNVLSLTLRGVVNNNPDDPEGLVPKDYATYQIFEKDDLVFKLIDLENFKTSRVGLVHERGVMSSAYIRVTPSRKGVPRYHYYQYYSLYHQGVYNKIGAGVRSTLGPTDLLEIPTLHPPRDEQDRIANFLDQKSAEIDEAIAKKQRLIELLKEQKAILINQAVTKGLNRNVPMRDSGVEWIGEVPKHWDVKKLKYYSKVQSGITLGKLYSGNKLVTAPYLRVANVQDGYFKLDEIAELQLPQRVIDQYLVRVGDILVTEGGDIDKLGRGTVWEGEIENCIHQNHIFAVRINKTVASEYFVSVAMSADYGRKYFTHTANKTTNLASTNQTKLGNFPIALPPPSEQKLIMDYVNDINSRYGVVISTAEREIFNLNELRQIVIAEAVTGKIKI